MPGASHALTPMQPGTGDMVIVREVEALAHTCTRAPGTLLS